MSYKIVSKYIKKLDFIIPNPKIFSELAKNISNYKINIDIRSNKLKEKIIDVETTLSLLPSKDDSEKITTKIIYSTIIELTTFIQDKKQMEKIVLIDVPKEIYPEMRKTFVFLFETSGFKGINISKEIDFEKLYNLKKNQ